MPINVLVLYFIFLSYQSHIFSIFSTFLLSSYIFSFSNFSFMSHLFHIKLSLLFFHFQVLSFALSHVYFCFLKACFSFFFLQYLRLYCILLFSIFSFPVLCSFTFIFSLVLHIFSAILFSITFASHTCSQFVFSISPSHFKKSLLCLTE